MKDRRCLLVTIIVTGLLACLPTHANAHLQLAGSWISPTPPGGFIVYHFCVGEHLGNGVWRGRFTLNVSNSSILTGDFGPLSTQTSINPNVGTVDLASGVFLLQNVTYRRRAPMLGPMIAPSRIP